MKTLQQFLVEHAFENENITYQTDEDLVTYIRATKKAVKDWIDQEIQEIEDRPVTDDYDFDRDVHQEQILEHLKEQIDSCAQKDQKVEQ